MSLLASLRSFVLAVVFRRRMEYEMEIEWRFHLDARVERLMAGGRSRADAEHLARAEFGDPLRWREQGREARGLRLLQELQSDARYALRQVRRSPGFTLVVVATIALGIGTNTAMFSVVDAILLRPLPFQEPNRLVRIWEVSPPGIRRNVVSSGNYHDWHDRAGSFEALGAHGWAGGAAMTGTGEPTRVEVARISPSALQVLGVSARVGRTFGPEESESVALLSQAFWEQRFASDPDIAGRAIRLDDRVYTILGVMPAGFDFPTPRIQVWLPLMFGGGADQSGSAPTYSRTERRAHQWGVIGRLKPGVSLKSSRAEMSAVASAITKLHPQDMTGWQVNVVPLHEDLVGDVETLVWTLAGLVGAVLAIAAANLANLLLARARSRESDFALRAALGAGRARLARQIVTEIVLLGLFGGALGLGIAGVMLPMLVAAAPATIPLLDDVGVDGTVLAFAASLTIGTSLAIALVPAIRISWTDIRPSVHSARIHGDVRTGRAHRAILVSQFALSVIVLIVAALLVESFGRLTAVDYGFDPRGIVTAWVDLPRARYPDQAAQLRFYDGLLERVRALPGIESVATTTEPPISGYTQTFSFAIEGRPSSNPSGREDPVYLRAVSAGYFETLSIPLVRGRVLEPDDRRDAPLALVINRSLAERFWPNDNPIGQRVSFVASGPWYEIVGIVGDTRHDGLDAPARPAMYMTFAQRQPNWGWMSWQIVMARARSGMDPATLTSAIREAVWSLDKDLPLQSAATVEGLYAESMARRRFAMQLASGFAALALLLTAVGIYGVVAYSVEERRQEIGVRIALGARPRQVVGLMMRTGLGAAAAGVVIGVMSAAGVTRFASALLFEISPTDPATFGAASAVVLLLAAAAAWVPARRATLIEPTRALRGE